MWCSVGLLYVLFYILRVDMLDVAEFTIVSPERPKNSALQGVEKIILNFKSNFPAEDKRIYAACLVIYNVLLIFY